MTPLALVTQLHLPNGQPNTDLKPNASAFGKLPGDVNITVYHNIVWSKYKGAVFSALNELTPPPGWSFSFVQIAETEGDRAVLNPVDRRYHRYPFELMFTGTYDAVPTWRLVWQLTRHVLQHDADLVVLPGFHRVEYWAMLLACIVSGKPRAVFCDSTRNDKPRLYSKRLLKRIFFSLCDGYFGYGQRSAEYLLDNGARRDRIFERCQAAALPIGFDAATALAQRIEARRQHPDARFVFVGRLSPEKNLGTLLKAFAQFRAQRHTGTLALVGAGPARAALEAQAAELGLGSSVEFLGAMDLDAVTAQYARALCMVLPSTSEPWGLVVNEALHYGCPVLVSEACGCRPELVIDGITGYAFEATNVAQLAQRMGLAMDNFRDEAAVAARCQHHIDSFSPIHAAAQIMAGCMHIVKAQQPPRRRA